MPIFNENLEAVQGMPIGAQIFKELLIYHADFLTSFP
jgi:hypothetical protein